MAASAKCGSEPMIGGAIRRVREHLAEPLNRTALAVIVSTLLTSVLGFGFWVVAALIYDPEIVGRDNALVSAMMLIATVCLLNLNNVLMRFLPQVREDVGKRVIQAYAISASASFTVGFAFSFFAVEFSEDLEFLSNSLLWALGFAATCAMWTLWVMRDAAFVALGKAEWMVPGNAAFSIAKILALPAFYVVAKEHGVYVAWVIPALLILPVTNMFIFRKAVPEAQAAQAGAGGVVDVFGWRRLVTFVGLDFIGSAIGEVVVVAMPLVVITLLDATETAYFSIAFMVIAALDLMYYAVTVALTTEGARDPARIGELTAMAVNRLLKFQIPVSLAIVVAAPLVLLPFPSEYGDNATTALRLLALSCGLRAVVLLYQAAMRLQGHGVRLMAVQAANTFGVVALAALLAPDHGIDGIAVGWLITHGVLALLALPDTIKFIRNPGIRARDVVDPLGDAPPL
ncbi:MAG: hypothetical protein WAP35_02420 [Solirubrobacterales bacterium]